MLDWKDYVSEVHELIGDIKGSASLEKFCEELAEGLETTTDNIRVVRGSGSNSYVEFFEVKLCGKAELRDYFTVQETIPILKYSLISELLESSQGKVAFVRNVCKALENPSIAKYFNGAVVMDNKNFLTREELREYFREKYDISSLQEMCEHTEVSLDGSSILCDGIAYIGIDEEALSDGIRHKYPIEGYLTPKGQIKWTFVDESAFTPIETTGGKIYVLRAFQGRYRLFYRTVLPTDIGVKHKPYPVAILDKKTYAFYYK